MSAGSMVAALSILFPPWLRQTVVTMLTLGASYMILVAARKLWREWKRAKWYGRLKRVTNWTMLPLKESCAAGTEQAGLVTDVMMDALARAGHELQQPLWSPHLLLLRPTPPANYEPAVLTKFLSDQQNSIVIAPPADDLCLEWELHDIELDAAVQALELKPAAGLDIGSVARLLSSVARWFNAGTPAIAGKADIGGKCASIQLAARGGPIKSVAVGASTDAAPGIDAAELTAARVAFKFLFRMKYPDMTNDQIDGLSALRQGATLFGQYAETAPGVGDHAELRRSSLAKAAFNLNFFRTSIPRHCNPGGGRPKRSSLEIDDEVRQAALLAEGVAHALVGTDDERMNAVECFRQLQDWPGSSKTAYLRQQAAYNEAIVWSHAGNLARTALMLTELLGEKTPDTIPRGPEEVLPLHEEKAVLVEAIEVLAKVARAVAVGRYSREAFEAMPLARAEWIVSKTGEIRATLDKRCSEPETSPHDRRILRYMYAEVLKSLGHMILLLVIRTNASTLYENKRPLGLRRRDLDEKGTRLLLDATKYLRTCEDLAPSSQLYCDLAESYLLLKDLSAAEGYARHATLDCDKPNERAYYIAAESLLLENTERSIAMAEKYVADFNGPITLDEFKLLREELAVRKKARTAAA